MRPYFLATQLFAALLFDKPSGRTLGQMSTAKVISEQEIERLDEEALSPSARKMRMLKKLHCGLRYEKAARAAGAVLIAGVDEVGRGALFGPVVAAAVILPPECRIRGLRDSKQLEREDRERLAKVVETRAGEAWPHAAAPLQLSAGSAALAALGLSNSN